MPRDQTYCIQTPCPFCGCDKTFMSDFRGLWHIRCANCGAEGPDGATREEAVVRWNRRQTDDDLK